MEVVNNWYALYTKPRAEFVAEQQLNEVGITTYLPTFQRLRKWSDRKKKIIEPLFRSYIFIYSTEPQRSLACEAEAVVRTIFFGGKPSIIPASQIENVKKILSRTNDVNVIEGIVKGTLVKIVDGPFADIEGVVYSQLNDESMLAVSIELLNRSVIVQLPKNSIVKIAS